MWVDIFISGALAILTVAMAYLGVHVTLHPADSQREKLFYKVGFSTCAIFAVVLVVWQGARNSASQQNFMADVGTAKNEATAAKLEASSAKSETSKLRSDLVAESAKREQAEKDLGITVQKTELHLSKQMTDTQTVLSTNINTYRTDTTNAVSKLVRPGRSFTPSQRASLIRQLKATVVTTWLLRQHAAIRSA